MIDNVPEWRDKLLSQVYFEKDKILIGEALDCFQGNSYRAGYIVAWLAIVESLRNKIKELAGTGNKQAENSILAIEKEEAALRSNDIKIIDESHNCGFINKVEKDEIIFLWSQRCKFAHPYFVAPTQMELAYIIEKSITLALCKEIVFKKDYIDELITDICETAHFIKDDEQYINAHSADKLARIDVSLHSYFFKTLFFKFSEAYDRDSSSQIK